MQEFKDMEEVFANLTEENKTILLMIANGMFLSRKEENTNEKVS